MSDAETEKTRWTVSTPKRIKDRVDEERDKRELNRSQTLVRMVEEWEEGQQEETEDQRSHRDVPSLRFQLERDVLPNLRWLLVSAAGAATSAAVDAPSVLVAATMLVTGIFLLITIPGLVFRVARFVEADGTTDDADDSDNSRRAAGGAD